MSSSMLLICILLFSHHILLLWSENKKMKKCPSDEYTVCAYNNGVCDIPSTISEGYISYGSGKYGRFTLLPFSNAKTDTTHMSIKCDSNLGDVSVAFAKYSFEHWISTKIMYCCYVRADTGLLLTSGRGDFDGYLKQNDRRPWKHPHKWATIRYGADNRFVYRSVFGAKVFCNNKLGQPVPTLSKHCRSKYEVPLSLSSILPPDSSKRSPKKWKECGREGHLCTGLGKSAAHWIRYGTYNEDYFRLIVSINGEVPCNNAVFGGDPSPKKKKWCWRSPSLYTFSGVVGQWKEVKYCKGCPPHTWKTNIGITKLDEKQITKTFQYELEVSLSAKMGFTVKALSAEVSRTFTGRYARTVATTLKTASTMSKAVSSETPCDKKYLYQFVTSVTQNNGLYSQEFKIHSQKFLCTKKANPICPPGFCQDEDCQKCKKFESDQSDLYPEINPKLIVLFCIIGLFCFVGTICVGFMTGFMITKLLKKYRNIHKNQTFLL